MYPGTRLQGKSPRAAKAMLTAGLRCAPETAPMNRITAITMRPGATTAAVGETEPGTTAFTTVAPAGDDDQEERSDDLGEQPPPLESRVVECLAVDRKPP